MNFTVRDIVDYIIANRNGNAFKNWKPDDIAISLRDAIANNLLAVVTDNGSISGICLCDKFEDKETIHVMNVLANPGCMKYMISICRRLHPNVKYVSGERLKNGVVKTYKYPICKILK